MTALQLAAHLTEAEVQAACLSIEDHKNIAIIETTKTTTAAKIDKINAVCFEGGARKVCTYIVPPEKSCKGVIHKIRAGTVDLKAHLNAGGVTILNAQMMGPHRICPHHFQGSHIPRTVLHRQGEYRCMPHHSKVQFRTTCFAIGHKADVRPPAGTHRCRHCGVRLSSPDQDHTCNPGCVNCGKDHPVTAQSVRFA